MSTVVITGSARGFGLAMAKSFRRNNFNVCLTDVLEEELEKGKNILLNEPGLGSVDTYKMDVTNEEEVVSTINQIIEKYKTIEIWINNAGVNQNNENLWNISKHTIDKLIDIDLKGTIICSKQIMNIMIKQNHGQIFNVEGLGSDNQKQLGLSLYGTAKRAVTYFTEALAFENKKLKTGILIGKITPGIMITNFINTSLGNEEKIDLPDKVKKVYNILGDYPETIANYVVPKIISNTKNDQKIVWLTKYRAFMKFLTYHKTKQDYFK